MAVPAKCVAGGIDGRAFQIVPDSDEEQTLAILRYPVPDGVEDRVSNPVSARGQIRCGVIGDVSPSDGKHSRNVLHHHSERPPQLRCVKESKVQLVARIGRVALLGEAVQLRSTDPREALARRASYEDVWPAPCSESVADPVSSRLPSSPERTNGRRLRLQPADVLRVSAGRRLVNVNGGENVAASGLKAEAEAARTTEQVYDARGALGSGSSLVNSGTRPLPRQEDPDTGSPTSPIGQSVNLAAVHLHDAASDGEAHSLPTFLARKEWLEHAVSDGVGNSRSVIRKNDFALLFRTPRADSNPRLPDSMKPIKRVRRQDVEQAMECLRPHLNPHDVRSFATRFPFPRLPDPRRAASVP